MSIIIKQTFDPEFLQEAFVQLPPEGKLIFLQHYAETEKSSRPTSEKLIELFGHTASDVSLPIKVRVLAFGIYQEFVNPFSNIAIPADIQMPSASAAIPDSYLGCKVGNEGYYAGTREYGSRIYNFFADTEFLKNASGKPSVETFNDHVSYLNKLGTIRGHQVFTCENPREYQDRLNEAFACGSIEGKLFIPQIEDVSGRNIKDEKVQPNNMIDLLNLREFPENVNLIASRSSHPYNPDEVRIADVRDGVDTWTYRDGHCASVLFGHVVEVKHLTQHLTL